MVLAKLKTEGTQVLAIQKSVELSGSLLVSYGGNVEATLEKRKFISKARTRDQVLILWNLGSKRNFMMILAQNVCRTRRIFSSNDGHDPRGLS